MPPHVIEQGAGEGHVVPAVVDEVRDPALAEELGGELPAPYLLEPHRPLRDHPELPAPLVLAVLALEGELDEVVEVDDPAGGEAAADEGLDNGQVKLEDVIAANHCAGLLYDGHEPGQIGVVEEVLGVAVVRDEDRDPGLPGPCGTPPRVVGGEARLEVERDDADLRWGCCPGGRRRSRPAARGQRGRCRRFAAAGRPR